MKAEVQAQLLALNRAFYVAVADEFDRTRQGLPDGMLQLARRLRPTDGNRLRVLDVGCGNGRFARALATAGALCDYLGIDADEHLLATAADQTSDLPGVSCHFHLADLADPAWTAVVARQPPFDTVVCLAVLHHFPGFLLRQRLIEEMAAQVAPAGVLVLSTWQFLSAERLAEKCMPWATVGLTNADVEPGDALLPWNRGVHAVRYVHHIDEGEIERLTAALHWHVAESFRADGKEGNLNLFVVLRRG